RIPEQGTVFGERTDSGAAPIFQTEDDAYFVIEDFEQIPPFFCSLTSDSNLWLFVSSTGALTAGRGDADHAILPYETVDKIHDSGAHTGPIVFLRWQVNGRWVLWEPFRGQ